MNKFRVGDIVEFKDVGYQCLSFGDGSYCEGDRARVDKRYNNINGSSMISITWLVHKGSRVEFNPNWSSNDFMLVEPDEPDVPFDIRDLDKPIEVRRSRLID